jgi:hypothetical protein
VGKLQGRIEKQRKAGSILRSYINPHDSSISIFPTSGDVPAAPPDVAPGVAPPVYEDVDTAQVATAQPSFGAPVVEPPPSAEFPVTPPGVGAGGEYEMQIPVVDEPGAIPSMEMGEMGAEAADLNEIRSMLYTFERKLADYEKRLHYIDKYTEMIQRQQNKKFKAQKELLALESRKGKWLGVGIGIGALTVAIIVLLASLDKLGELFGGLF